MANYCFVAPLLPGGEARMRSFLSTEIKNNPNHNRVLHSAGVSREQVWIQRTPMGDFAVASFEVVDPEKTFKVLGTSTDPWAVKFREFLVQAHGFDLTHPVPVNELVVDWRAA
jgi:hypothetical protein